jgi:hypothetical protein
MPIDSICVAGIREDAALVFCFRGNHPHYQTGNHLSGEQDIVSNSLDHANDEEDGHFRHLINPLNHDRAFNNINRAGLARCLGKFIFNPGNRPWSPLIFGHDLTFAANPLEFPSRDPWSETSGTTMTTEQEQPMRMPAPQIVVYRSTPENRTIHPESQSANRNFPESRLCRSMN